LNNVNGKRRIALGFSVVGSLLLILFFAYINFSTDSRFPWFIYPAFAVIWWPLGVLFAGRRSMKFASLVGSISIIALLVITNYLTSWDYPWFLYPSFAVIWWPIAVIFGRNRGKLLSVIGSVSIIAFSVAANYIISSSYIWFYYPIFAVVWWPLSVFLGRQRYTRAYSLTGAAVILAFLGLDNYINLPNIPWVLFTVFPVLMWPAFVLLGKHARKLPTASLLSIIGIACYAGLNMYVFPGFPWAIFPAYLLIWWPICVIFAGRGQPLMFSLCGTVLSTAFFIAVNIIVSPLTVWAVYPIFALAWWPLSVYYFVNKPQRILRQHNSRTV
jgi:hypothetical protein